MELYKNSLWKNVDFNSINKSIPSDWNSLAIGKIIVPNPKSKIKAGEGKKIGVYPFFNCSETQTKYTNSFLVDKENIFITTGGDYMFNLYFNGESSYSTDVWSIKIKEHNTQFIHYFLKYNFETNQQYFRGFKFKHLDKKGFQKMVLPIPSFDEQNSIVSVLSYQENVILKTKCLIKELDKRNQFMISELLSGHLRVKEENEQTIFYKNSDDNWQSVNVNGEVIKIPKDWNSFKLKENIEIKTGKKDANVAKNDGKYAFFTCGKQVLKTNTYDFDCEAVLIAGNGDVGDTKYYQGKFDAYQRTYVLSNYKYDLKFLYIYMKKLFQDSINALGSAMPYIKLGDLENFSVNQPQNIIERQLLLKIITSLNEEKEKYEQILEQEEKKFTFLLEELMSGRLRVKV